MWKGQLNIQLNFAQLSLVIVFLFNTHFLSNLQSPCCAAMDPLLKTTDPNTFEADISSSKQTFAMCFPYLSFTSHVLKQYTQIAKKKH